jgi:hypothetical protein
VNAFALIYGVKNLKTILIKLQKLLTHNLNLIL